MLRLVADENFHDAIVRGLIAHRPEIELLRVEDVLYRGVDDPTILAWAAEQNRIVLTHDRGTMRAFAEDRLQAGQPMPGVIFVKQSYPVGRAVDDVLLMDACSEQHEWQNQFVYIPL